MFIHWYVDQGILAVIFVWIFCDVSSDVVGLMCPLNTVLLLVYMFSMVTQTGGDDQDISERHSIIKSDAQSEDDLFPVPRTSAHPPDQEETSMKSISSSSADMEKEDTEIKKEGENKKTTISNIVSNAEKPTVHGETSKRPDPKKKNRAVERVRSTGFLTSVLSLAGVWWLLTSFLCSLLYCIHWICSKHGWDNTGPNLVTFCLNN